VRDFLPGADLVLVFAGDGTMVSVARQSLGRSLPIAGVNFGRVGFLAELSADNWREHLQKALDAGILIERRMSLYWSLNREGHTPLRGEVVNDAVVTRGKVARLVSLHLAVNGRPFVSLRSEGLILSTPTGSSGYACSAGGSLLLPTLNAYVVAAICPYLSSFPPLALSPETVFSVSVGEAVPDLYLTLDGQEAHPLAEGDRLDVYGAPERVLMADFGLKNYFERLCRAGFVQAEGCR
jgi:NAD+ kinase